ncbi:MAG TPA: hypothetical protein VH186_16585 [Chloroflexia bacterium]|nr:hypothetical protein [Chloroflexia bacterium]
MPPALTPGSTVLSLKETVAALQQRAASALYGWLNWRDFNPNIPIEPQTRMEEKTGGYDPAGISDCLTR